jgi:hypothetical protein
MFHIPSPKFLTLTLTLTDGSPSDGVTSHLRWVWQTLHPCALTDVQKGWAGNDET